MQGKSQKINIGSATNYSQNKLSIFQSNELNSQYKHLVNAVISGEPTDVKKILIQYPQLLKHRADITDLSGRVFPNCTVFEYVVWALDVKFMARDMIDALPHNETGESIRLDVKQQFEKLCTNGITFYLNGKKHQESHFDIEPVKQAYQEYIYCCNNWDTNQRQKYWGQVSKLQMLFPMHLVQHICDTTMVFDEPDFKSNRFYRYLIKVFDEDRISNTPWFELLAKNDDHAGHSAIIRIDNSIKTVHFPEEQDCKKNLNFISSLFDQRMRGDMKSLSSLVSTSLLQDENQLII